jgi:hypothetical protein
MNKPVRLLTAVAVTLGLSLGTAGAASAAAKPRYNPNAYHISPAGMVAGCNWYDNYGENIIDTLTSDEETDNSDLEVANDFQDVDLSYVEADGWQWYADARAAMSEPAPPNAVARLHWHSYLSYEARLGKDDGTGDIDDALTTLDLDQAQYNAVSAYVNLLPATC